MDTNILTETNKAVTDPLIQLFKVDLTNLGGTVFYFVPMSISYSSISFMGETWVPFPAQITGIGAVYGQAPARPIMTVSNVAKILQAAIVNYGDIVGGTVTRYRTFRKFLADGSSPNNNAIFPPDVYIIDQKTSHTKAAISWNLVSILDVDDYKLPGRQMLRQTVNNQPGFPGLASSTRFRN